MERIAISSFAGFPLIREGMILGKTKDGGPCIILNDEKLGYWGFVDDPTELGRLKAWLIQTLSEDK